MALKIYNTQTKRKEEFVPLSEGKVGLYVCGITAYDVCHVGHARSAVVFDVVVRYLRERGYAVTYVKNFTDVDDKIIEKANRLGLSIAAIAERYIAEHDEDMRALGVAPPTVAPRATENIDGMVRLIQRLVDSGLAYVVDGNVYYAVERFRSYGKLSGRSTEELLAGARVEVNERKQNPLDFVLWKASKAGEPFWESPWGTGRPGWHIECSVMSQRYLGEQFDIHGGGADLVFPHHENEIAQSEGATGKSLAAYWMHNGFVRINSEKMSKSLGNVFTIKEILKNYHPEVLRLFMLQGHYRSPLDFSNEAMEEARSGLNRLYGTLKSARDLGAAAETAQRGSTTSRGEEISGRLAELGRNFHAAMEDDFNTARAVGYLFETSRYLNGCFAGKGFPAGSAAAPLTAEILAVFDKIGAVLGLLREEPDAYFRQDRERRTAQLGLDAGEIERLVEERTKARVEKDWRRADEIRELLAARKVIIQDSPSGTVWGIE
jgi:cysteinyl-tRNA synthetase